MAQLLPDVSSFLAGSNGYWREIDVLQHLQQSLPEGYEIFHGADWHSLHEGRDCHGEIDLVVMYQARALLLVEVKAGKVCVRDGGGVGAERPCRRKIVGRDELCITR